MIDAKRFERNFNAISEFGALKGGGLTRLAFSKEDLEAREFLINLIKKMALNLKLTMSATSMPSMMRVARQTRSQFAWALT